MKFHCGRSYFLFVQIMWIKYINNAFIWNGWQNCVKGILRELVQTNQTKAYYSSEATYYLWGMNTCKSWHAVVREPHKAMLIINILAIFQASTIQRVFCIVFITPSLPFSISHCQHLFLTEMHNLWSVYLKVVALLLLLQVQHVITCNLPYLTLSFMLPQCQCHYIWI